MPKTYDFVITVRPAEFSGRNISVSYSRGAPEFPFTGALADALIERERLSNSAGFPCAAFLNMKDPSARKPPGFNAATLASYSRQ